VNQTFFLTQLTATIPRDTRLRCNNLWSIVTQVDSSELTVSNAGTLHVTVQPQASTKGFLRKTSSLHPTQLEVTELKLEHPAAALPVLLDGQTTLKTPVTITLKPKALKVIVGKHRLV